MRLFIYDYIWAIFFISSNFIFHLKKYENYPVNYFVIIFPVYTNERNYTRKRKYIWTYIYNYNYNYIYLYIFLYKKFFTGYLLLYLSRISYVQASFSLAYQIMFI